MSNIVEFTIDEMKFLRSEILGMQYMYILLKELTEAYLELDEIIEEVKVIFPELREYEKKDLYNVFKKKFDLLKTITAIDETISEKKLFLTRHGKTWFDLLTELNLPVQRIKPLEIVSEDVPGKFFVLFRSRVEEVNRIVIVSPWITEKSLVRRICKLIKNYSITTYVFTRSPSEDPKKSPEDQNHAYSLHLLKDSGATIYINENIHSKLYLCETKINKPYNSFGIICSANLTRNARHKNIEVGILIYGFTDRYFNLIENLIQSCYSLKSREW